MSTPYLIGSNSAAAGSATLVILVSTATALGDAIVVGADSNATAGIPSFVTDSKGNAYRLVQSDGNQLPSAMFIADSAKNPGGPAALTTSDTITVQYPGTSGAKVAIAVGASGLAPSPVDQAPTPTDNAGSTSPSITSGALVSQPETCIAVEVNASTGGAVTWGSGWTGLATVQAPSSHYLSMAYHTATSTGAVTASGTIVSAKWTMYLVTLETLLVITTASLPNATDGTAYSQTVAAAGGAGGNTFSVTSGALPPWASLNATTGVVSGTASGSGSATFTVTVTDSAGSTASQSYTVQTLLQPYVAGSASAASGGSTSLPVPITTATQSGDTVLVGVLASASGVTPSVSDSAGNSYSLILSDTTETAAQLFVFEAPSASPIPVGTGSSSGTPGPVGSTIATGPFPAGTSQDTAMADWNSVTGTTDQIMKIYFTDGQYPTTPTVQLQGCIDKGIPAILCYKPSYTSLSSSDTTAMVNSINAFIAAGLSRSSIVVLWQEPQNTGGPTASQYVAMVRFHSSALRATGLKLYYDSAGHTPADYLTYYPGKNYVDGIAVDLYANAYANGIRIDPLNTQAITDGLPFGIFEIGITSGNTVPSKATFEAYLSYLQSIMVGRLQQGLVNGPALWYNEIPGGNGDNPIVPLNSTGVSYANYIAQTLWGRFYTALTAAPVTSAPVTVAYSSNSSKQAAIVVGVSNVSGRDKAVVAHGNSTAPSSGSSGTLSQAQEQAVSFLASNGGGTPSWAAGWTELAHTDSALDAADQVVTSTAALTASATIASVAWTVAEITYASSTPIVTTVMSDGFVNEPYSQTLYATGATPPYTWSVTGALPAGLSLNSSTGVVSGTPTAAGTYTFTTSATDSLGVVGSISQTVIISAAAPGVAPAMTLPTNILTPADSDFEVAGFTWKKNLNANTPARTSQVSLTGGYSLYWQSKGPGASSLHTGSYPVQPNSPYVASAFIMPSSPQNVAIGIRWLDSTGAQIGAEVAGPYNPVGPLQWQPCQGAFTSPANAASAQLVAFVAGGNAGDVTHLDLAFWTQCNAQVLIDWENATFATAGAAGQAFMDVTPWTRWDIGITMTRGRQDAISEMQPGWAGFTLQNDQGQFTRESASSVVTASGGTVTVGRRCQINLADENGGWYTRFDGPLSEIDYGFDNTGNTSVAQVAVTDVLSYLNRQDAMSCWTKEQVLAGGPQFHWSLDDSGTVGGAGVAAETSGNNGPPMRLINSDSTKTATIAWQDTSSGVETLADAVSATSPDGSSFWAPGQVVPNSPIRGLVPGTAGPYTTPISSVLLTPVQTAQSAQNTFIGNTGYMLQADLTTPLTPTAAGSDYSLEIWFTMDPSIATHLGSNYGPYIAFGLGSSRTYTNLLAGLFLNSGTLSIECATYNQPPAFKGLNWAGVAAPSATASTSGTIAADKAKLPHHLVVTIQGDPTAATVTLWLDGNTIGSFTLPKGQTYDAVTVGSAYGGCGAWFGNLSLMSVYPYALTQQQITLNCQLGQYGMWETLTDDCIAQISEYANVPGFWSNLSGQHFGLSMTEYIDINGSNPLTSMQVFEKAEMGLLFIDATGALNFHTRDWRMGYGAPDLYLPPGTFGEDLQYKIVDQFMTNEDYVSGPSTLGAAATTLANPTGSTATPQTTGQSLVTGGYVNTASQAAYGVYAQNPVTSPLPLPLITWSRGAAVLGLPSFSYWADPNLYDHGAWNANSRADPWILPASVTIDLLTLDQTTGLAISDFYGLEIDNVIAPSGVLPPSFPTGTLSVEWFIEGVTETISQTSRTIQFYTSPAEPQRAWVPGDPVYGVLGSTTRIGISAPDTSTPQAYGKDVSHDAGPPYWPPTFDANMNNPNGLGSAFVGSNDMRGLAQNLQTMLAPPLCVVSASSETQNVNNGSLSSPQLFWDVVHVDTASGMGLISGWPNWYVVTVPGWYEIDACVTWSITGAGLGGYTGQAWIVVALGAAQALAAGTGTPTTVGQYVCPVGEAVRFNASSMTPVCAATTRMYLGMGDMVCVAAEQNFTSNRGTTTTGAGSMMSIRFTGLGQVDDRTEINSSIANGGTVSLVSHGVPQQVTFSNTATYSYQGDKGFLPNGRRNTNGNCYQGVKGSTDSEGSQVSQIAFNASSIQSTLSGHTIIAATLSCSNLGSWYSTGCKMRLGTTTKTPGGASFDPGKSGSTPNIVRQAFKQNQALTFTIPASIVQAFVSHGATALVLGDGDTTNLEDYGLWAGGAGAWTLTVNYV